MVAGTPFRLTRILFEPSLNFIRRAASGRHRLAIGKNKLKASIRRENNALDRSASFVDLPN